MGTRWTIYRHSHVASGRCYIGLTKLTMMKRWNQHLSNAKKKHGKGCRHFWNAIRSYGKSAFSHEVLEVCNDLDVANLAEECWIELFDSRNPEKGFNLTKGGGHMPHPVKNPWLRPGFREKCKSTWDHLRLDPDFRERLKTASSANHRAAVSSPEYKDKIRAALAVRFQDPVERNALANRMRGIPLSEESRKKISESGRSRVVSEETRAKLSAAGKGRRLSSDSVRKGVETRKSLPKKTHCKHGHSLDDCHVRPNGERTCRTCVRDRGRRRRSSTDR